MEFTYKAYGSLLALLRKNGYEICTYHDYVSFDKCAIIRHDVDMSLEKAVALAEYEYTHAVRSTYFLLLSSDLYNVASSRCSRLISEILGFGHNIGLHFDETRYSNTSKPMSEIIEQETRVLSEILGACINSVSMHRPSSETLAANYQLANAANSYSKTFFDEFKYLSDSRRHWREPIIDIVESNLHKKLHILTHPFWYSKESLSASDICISFVNSANRERYNQMTNNIRDFTEFMEEREVI